ncbi:MAG: tRNA (N6-isopentenyl adenosine(37)-C2)-methylthiotransferase MiaB [Gemmatimonadota bacterium]
MTSTVYIETYGCQMNVSDTELMLGKLSEHGYEPVETAAEADVILVNTCAIRDRAEQRVLGRLGELKREMKSGAIVGVTGCMAQRLGPVLLEKARHVSLVVGPDGYRGLAQLIARARDGERAVDTAFDLGEHYENLEPRRLDSVRAWIPVQRGCNYNCTYCIVPFTRGPERSRPASEVVREVEQAVAEGITEVTLLGQTVNSWTDGANGFGYLLRTVGAVPGLRRLRFTSPHPNDFSDDVIEAMASTPSVCEHVHLPMQSGSTAILKKMLRRYGRDDFLACVDRLRRAIPGLAITTDIIVAFPGERDRDFEETLSAVREVSFDDAFTFRFSPRDGTPATRMPVEWTVPDEVAAERMRRLIATVRDVARERNLRLLGERRELLMEKSARRGELLQGRSRDYKTVLVPGDDALIGTYVTVELTGTTGSTFTGSAIPGRGALPMMA